MRTITQATSNHIAEVILEIRKWLRYLLRKKSEIIHNHFKIYKPEYTEYGDNDTGDDNNS